MSIEPSAERSGWPPRCLIHPLRSKIGLGGVRVRSLHQIAILFLTIAVIAVAAGTARAQTADLSGLWTGTTRVVPPCSFSSGRCNAVNKITFSLRLKGDRIKGKFTCAYGTL